MKKFSDWKREEIEDVFLLTEVEDKKNSLIFQI